MRQTTKENGGKKDIHKSNIVMLAIRNANLMSLCAQGVLAEWQISFAQEDADMDGGAEPES